ncbi:MAG: hypothetical protein QMC67_05405 [Candidatus Wallbacteria bacterium]
MKRKTLDLEWLEEIGYEEFLEGDTRVIFEMCGPVALKQLWEGCAQMNLYISTKPIRAAMAKYIEKYYDGTNAKQLAQKLGCSESFVYQKGNHSVITGDLFEK